jgi:hypothetical protein
MFGMTNFSGFDTYLEPRLDGSASRLTHSIVRFYIDYPGAASGMPTFLVDGGLAFDNYTEFGGGRSPDYASDSLVSALERFIAALGERYDGDPRIFCIQIGLLGFWGEW